MMPESDGIHWLIEADVFPDYQDELLRVVRETGAKATLLTGAKAGYSFDEAGQPDLRIVNNSERVIFHGCIGLAERIVERTIWKPGVYGDFDRLSCTSYFPVFGEFLLNDRYSMLPLGDVRRMREELFSRFGSTGQFFMRPNTTRKVFAGMVISHETFDRDLEFASFYDVPAHELVVVSPVQSIDSEWRFVVAGGRVVCGSCYHDHDKPCRTATYSPEAYQFAESVANAGWEPDPVWTIDVALNAAGSYRLIEIGSFSYANLYGCDLRKMVDAVQTVAVSGG